MTKLDDHEVKSVIVTILKWTVTHTHGYWDDLRQFLPFTKVNMRTHGWFSSKSPSQRYSIVTIVANTCQKPSGWECGSQVEATSMLGAFIQPSSSILQLPAIRISSHKVVPHSSLSWFISPISGGLWEFYLIVHGDYQPAYTWDHLAGDLVQNQLLIFCWQRWLRWFLHHRTVDGFSSYRGWLLAVFP